MQYYLVLLSILLVVGVYFYYRDNYWPVINDIKLVNMNEHARSGYLYVIIINDKCCVYMVGRICEYDIMISRTESYHGYRTTQRPKTIVMGARYQLKNYQIQINTLNISEQKLKLNNRMFHALDCMSDGIPETVD